MSLWPGLWWTAVPSSPPPSGGAAFWDPRHHLSPRSRVRFCTDEDFWISQCPTQVMVMNGSAREVRGLRSQRKVGEESTADQGEWRRGTVSSKSGGSQVRSSELEIAAVHTPGVWLWASSLLFPSLLLPMCSGSSWTWYVPQHRGCVQVK